MKNSCITMAVFSLLVMSPLNNAGAQKYNEMSKADKESAISWAKRGAQIRLNQLKLLGRNDPIADQYFCCNKNGCWEVGLLTICVGSDLIRVKCDDNGQNCEHDPIGGDN